MKVDCPTEQNSEFQPGMDPLGALERLRTEELIHAPENIVRYYKRTAEKETGKTIYDTTFPGIFRQGDIAEMHASLIAIQTGDKKIKVTCRLHAVTLLDNSFTKREQMPLFIDHYTAFNNKQTPLFTSSRQSRYRACLTLLRDGNNNQNVYKSNVFYDTCNELGILVRQDYQFGCGVYPAHDTFVASVREEAEDNVRYITLHWRYFAGTTIIIGRFCGKVWGGKEFPWQNYVKLGGHLVSEFGIPSHPERKTLEYWMDSAGAEARHPQSALTPQHCRAGSFDRRLAITRNEGSRVTEYLETYAYKTRINGSGGGGLRVSAAAQVGREGKGIRINGRRSGMAAEWLLAGNIVGDSRLFPAPQPVRFTIKKQLETYYMGVLRTVIIKKTTRTTALRITTNTATSKPTAPPSNLHPRAATLEIRCVGLESRWSTPTRKPSPSSPTKLPSSSRSRGPQQDVAAAPPTDDAQFESKHSVVVGARLLDGHGDGETGKVLARYADLPQPYRFIEPGSWGSRGWTCTLQINRATGEVRKEDAKSSPAGGSREGLGEREVEASWLG
ncbi:hypothetical protein B0H16DRAFT_1720878 [Mycena metata]|uniref:Uncharacterized protein n=1 Tax=Mycena metata TaxID=1033252 RepID=A0AAD7J6N6_9AGAR|nr:hypothetical protein B0H16DRAFT_1720878 [Mycena metata]